VVVSVAKIVFFQFFFFEEDNDACILKSYLCGW